MCLIVTMFVRMRLPLFFLVSEQALMDFVDSVRVHMGMYSNPYHNFTHGFDVMHAVFIFLTEMDAAYVRLQRVSRVICCCPQLTSF